jgi:hypothetical protein
MGIRSCLLFLLLTIVSGCTAVTGEVKETIKFALKEPKDAELSADEIRSFPYTSLYATWKDEARTLIVLGYVNKPDDWHFISAGKETLVVRNGRVIRTQDLNDNLLAISNLNEDPLTCLMTEPGKCQRRWEREYDYKIDGRTISRKVNSEFYVRERKTLNLPFGEVRTTLIEEKGRFLLTNETFTNRFWIENDGHVVKSEQHVFPGENSSLTLTQVTWIGRDYSKETAERARP